MGWEIWLQYRREIKAAPALEEAEAIFELKEKVSFCPNCKSLQTLLFSRGELVGQAGIASTMGLYIMIADQKVHAGFYSGY